MSTSTDNHQATEHLALLGYKDGDDIFFRAINKSEGSRQPINLQSKFPNLPAQLEHLNGDHGIYVVANGGGHKDVDVVAGRAIWYEHDDMPKEEQVYLWSELKLPEPTFQVDTGGKSIHSYWVLSEPVAIEHQPPEKEGGKGRCTGDWIDLQRDFLEYSNGDRSIKNPSRVMRLAGFTHKGTGDSSNIISRAGKTYSYDELRTLIPREVEKPKAERTAKKTRTPANRPAATQGKEFLPSDDAVSLRRFLSADSQTLVERGTSTNRNMAGTALARDLIGCESWLNKRGVSTTETAQKLFDNFCFASGLPDDIPDECDRIWESAMGDNPTPSRSEETLERVLEMALSKCEKRHFESSPNEGLVLVTREQDGEGGFKPVRKMIGNHLEAMAYVNTVEGNGSAIYLEFKTIRNQLQRWTMPRSYIVADTKLLLGELVGRGYHFRLGMKKDLIEFLNGLGFGLDRAYTLTDSTGWTSGNFITQTATYGDQTIRFGDIDGVKNGTCEVVGTLQNWTDRVAHFCGGNSRLIFSIGIAFAAPLLEPLEIESGGFHFFHSTSAGKTTLLMVAASVVGIRKIPQWNTTANGLEAIATAHNNMLLPLDEIGEANEKEVGRMAYMLANGQGKTRMTKQLTNRKPKTWKLLFASTGEVGMAEYIKQAGVQVKGGQEVRMPDIPAVPKDSPYGVFENIHGAKDSKEFAQALELACAENHGTAIDAYLSRLVVDLASEDTKKALRKRVLLIADKLTGSIQNFAIRRVANRFALVQVALGLAHSYDLLPFSVEDIDWAVSTLFQDWLTARGGDGSIEVKNACDAIGYLLTTQENGERFFTLPENDGLKPRNQLGYRSREVTSAGRDGTTYGGTEELWIFPEVFRKELCEGVNPTEIAKELVNRGWLTTGQSGNVTQTKKIKGNVQRFYVFKKWCLISRNNVFPGVTGVTTVTPAQEPVSEVTPEKDPSVTGVTLPPKVTPVTPEQKVSVTPESLSQQQVTPVTVVTPEEIRFQKLGTNLNICDVEEI
jgi:uncharacterized protein (DUF927 family)